LKKEAAKRYAMKPNFTQINGTEVQTVQTLFPNEKNTKNELLYNVEIVIAKTDISNRTMLLLGRLTSQTPTGQGPKAILTNEINFHPT